MGIKAADSFKHKVIMFASDLIVIEHCDVITVKSLLMKIRPSQYRISDWKTDDPHEQELNE